jgi:hypothetical protein
VTAFSKTPYSSTVQRKRRPKSTVLSSSPGFVGFRDDGGGGYSRSSNFGIGYSWEEQTGAYGRMSGQIAPYTSSSNLSRRRDSSSVAEDPRTFDYGSRYSQMPHPSMMMPPHLMQQSRSGFDNGLMIQGGSRQTYSNMMGGGGQAFVETDGRPLHVEMELYDGPNNTPTKVKMYSEDGRQRPMNINTNYYGSGRGGGTMSVRNVGSMEFPMRAGITSNQGGRGDYGRGRTGVMGEYGPMWGMMTSPYHDTSPIPSTARGITVQGGSLKTFKLPSYVNAAQVTITSDGLPVNAKVELWGSSSHVKQLAEVYNDNGQTRPFAAIIDVPGEENTIAVRNTGPLEYPIQVVVEPVGMGMGMGMGMGGQYYAGYGGMRGPPPPPMTDGPFMLPPPPPF